MQTSRFQLGLLTSLALALGYSVASSTAEGYPAGAAISTGSNPIRSATGHLDLGSESTRSDVMAAPSDQDLVLSDILLTITQGNDSCRGVGRAVLSGDDGVTYGEFGVSAPHVNYAQSQPMTLQAVSGIRVPAGTTLSLQWNWDYAYCGSSNYDLVYLFSGYLAQP